MAGSKSTAGASGRVQKKKPAAKPSTATNGSTSKSAFATVYSGTAKGTTDLPAARVKRIIKEDKDIGLVSNDAVFLVSMATVSLAPCEKKTQLLKRTKPLPYHHFSYSDKNQKETLTRTTLYFTPGFLGVLLGVVHTKGVQLGKDREEEKCILQAPRYGSYWEQELGAWSGTKMLKERRLTMPHFDSIWSFFAFSHSSNTIRLARVPSR